MSPPLNIFPTIFFNSNKASIAPLVAEVMRPREDTLAE